MRKCYVSKKSHFWKHGNIASLHPIKVPGTTGNRSQNHGIHDHTAEDAEVVGGVVGDGDGEVAWVVAVGGEDDLMLLGEVVISFYRIARAVIAGYDDIAVLDLTLLEARHDGDSGAVVDDPVHGFAVHPHEDHMRIAGVGPHDHVGHGDLRQER